MANRRQLIGNINLQNLNKNQHVVACLASSSIFAKSKFNINNNNANKDFSIKTRTLLFITLAIVFCFFINNCLSFAYQLNDLEEQWPDSSSIYWELGKNNNVNSDNNNNYEIENIIDENSLKKIVLPTSVSRTKQSRFGTNPLLSTDNYYITSPSRQSKLASLNSINGINNDQFIYEQQPVKEYIVASQINNDNNQQLGEEKLGNYRGGIDNFYYPIINSASSSSSSSPSSSSSSSSFDLNDNNNNNNNNDLSQEQTIVDFNSKLLDDLIDYKKHQLSHSKQLPTSTSNDYNNYNFDYDNNNNNYKQSSSNFRQNQFNYLDELNKNDDNSNSIEDKLNKKQQQTDENLYKIVERKNDNKKQRKFVTLLEDELNDNDNKNGQPEVTTISNDLSPSSSSTTTASYGKIITGRTSSSSAAEDDLSMSTTTAPASSMFNRMYKKLANYLPFLSQINILKNENDDSSSSTTTTTTTTDHNNGKTIEDEKNNFLSTINNNSSNKEDNKRINTKQSVSINSNKDEKNKLDEYNKEIRDYDLEKSASPKASKLYSSSSTSTSTSSANENYKGSTKSSNINSNNSSSLVNDDDEEEEEVDKTTKDDKKVSLLKKSSNIVMPLKANDELVLNQEKNSEFKLEPAASESLIGRYIYAPDNKLEGVTNSDLLLKSTNVKKLNNEQLYNKKLSQRAFNSRRLLDNSQDVDDDDITSTGADEAAAAAAGVDEFGVLYGQPVSRYSSSHRPLYYSQHHHQHRVMDNPMSEIMQQNNKTNDLYFLIMVGSFCAMAVAVVLAAGLFAYRVQQNRKTTNDNDYPTYGVVGPNNMLGNFGTNGKGGLGGTAIVGSYFNSNLNNSASNNLAGTIGGILNSNNNNNNNNSISPIGSKLGSAKHLPDLYSLSDSGVITSAAAGLTSTIATTTTGSSKSSSLHSSATSRRISSDKDNLSSLGNKIDRSSNFMANQDAARMYHYQHQKQQMIISDRASAGRHTSASDLDSEDENDDGSYTVYECPGLASAHEMEIKNPLFNDDQTP